jgi:hypothetical protein
MLHKCLKVKSDQIIKHRCNKKVIERPYVVLHPFNNFLMHVNIMFCLIKQKKKTYFFVLYLKQHI